MSAGILFLLLIFLGIPGTWAAAGPQWQGLAETVAVVKRSVVAVGTYQRTRTPAQRFQGTGFVVADGRHVLTNAHVLRGRGKKNESEILAVFFKAGDKDHLRAATPVAVDGKHDVALLKITGEPRPSLILGDSSRVREGELYAFTGFPIGMVLGLYPVTHRALISSITPIAIPTLRASRLDPGLIRRLHDPYRVFQLDATAYPGNSGSPLYDPASAVVVGIINSVFVKESKENLLTHPSGISFAIPIRYARRLLEKRGLLP